MPRHATKVRHRSAQYVTKSGRRVKSANSFGVHTNVFSFTFSHNWNQWKTFADEVKANLVAELTNKMAKVSKLIAEEAIARCPRYSGAMERAIRVSMPSVSSMSSRGNVSFAVGVLSTWKSPYDQDMIASGFSKGLASGPQLAAYIHETYDVFIGTTKQGLERKRRKEAISHRTVGSHFLTRAINENMDEIRAIIATWREHELFVSGMSTPKATFPKNAPIKFRQYNKMQSPESIVTEINALLDAASSKYDDLWFNASVF